MAKAVSAAAAPAEVGARDAPVDLLPGRLAHVVDEDRSGAGLDRERVRVAQAEGVDELVDTGGRPHERVAGRDQVPDSGVVACRDARVERADVDAELLAQEVGEGLRGPVSLPPLGESLQVVAGVGIEHAVEAEVDRAPVVVGGRAQVVPVEDRGLVLENRAGRVGVVQGEPAELVVLARRPGRPARTGVGVIQVDEVIRRERGVKRDAEQAALPLRIDAQMESGPGRAVSPDELDVPRLFEHEQAAVGGEFHRRGAVQSAGDRSLGEPGGQGRWGAPAFERLELR
jgi:hypothetical protein